MFLLMRDRTACEKALTKMRSCLSTFSPGPIRLLPAGPFWLGWFACKPSDNLHVFADGFVVGKIEFGETNRPDPINHQEGAPNELHPLLTSTVIGLRAEAPVVTPNGVTNVFYCRDAVSDTALLIADAKGLRPSPVGAAILSTAGYMPGTFTLFDEVRLVPPLHDYDPANCTIRQTRDFAPQQWDDDAMVERLVSIVPRGVDTYLGLSSGYDSRFVLGCVLRAGVRPSLVHLSSQENAVVAQIAYELNLPLRIDDGAPLLPAYLYTIMTDGQIYYRGGNYSRLRRSVSAASVYHCGLFSHSTIKPAAGSIVKLPGSRRNLLQKYLSFLCKFQTYREALQSLFHTKPESMMEPVLADLESRASYCQLDTPKQMACWLNQVFDDLRWVPAHMADISFYTYPVYLLSDFAALSFAIRSPLWHAMGNDRVRRLNAKLLPNLRARYDDGTRPKPYPKPVEPLHKLHYEYAHRALMVLKDRLQTRRERMGRSSSQSPDIDDAGPATASFSECYKEDLPDILAGRYPRSFKRAAITVYMCCRYLDTEEVRVIKTADERRSEPA